MKIEIVYYSLITFNKKQLNNLAIQQLNNLTNDNNKRPRNIFSTIYK